MIAKRAFDIVVSGMALLILSPALLVTAVAARLSTGRALFRQRRAGRDGEPFTLLKLRTMTSARDSAGLLLPDADRLTRVGRWLRLSSLDELPQLLNVLRGEMSLVGPRPLPVEYVALYTYRERARLRVRPGITGLAQVRGRQAISLEDRFELDVQYVESWTLWLDVKIIALTVPRLLKRTGALPGQNPTATDERGFIALWHGQHRPGQLD